MPGRTPGPATVLLLGASSPIVTAAAHGAAQQGWGLVLAGRDRDDLERRAADLRIRHQAPVSVLVFHAERYGDHAAFAEGVIDAFPALDAVVVGFGLSGDSARARTDIDHAVAVARTNYEGAVSVLTPFAEYFEQRGRGCIVGVTSVAGDRGRQSNYVYGSAKAGFAVFLEGLRHRLHRRGVRVVTIKPGYIDTTMTYGTVQSRLMASPRRVGRAIVRALARGSGVKYVPWYWRPVMAVIRAIPAPLFLRSRL